MAANTSFTGTPNPANPAATQALYPDWLLNPVGSEYAAQYGYDTTLHLQRAIMKDITDNIPAQFNVFRIVFSKPIKYVPMTEWTWTERTYPRPLLKAVSATGATPEVITLTAGGSLNVVQGDEIAYKDNTHAIVSAVNTTTNTITVLPLTGAGALPATVADDKFVIVKPVIADGMNVFVHYDRMATVKHTNYITRGQRNKRWTTVTALEYKNSGTTNYFEKDAQEKMELAMQDVFATFFNGVKGNVAITPPAGTGLTAGTYQAKLSDGVFPFMQATGSQNCASTTTTIEADFKRLAFSTNYKNVNVPRFILGTDKALNALGSTLKNPIRYNPGDKFYDMDLDEYRIGTMRFVPLVTPLFEERSYLFPASFENRLLVLDLDTIDPVSMQGLEPFMINNTGGLHKSKGGYNDYIDYFVEYNISMQMTNTDSSFWIDIVGI